MDYQRTARRIRARWQGQPLKIHAALAKLNAAANLSATQSESIPPMQLRIHGIPGAPNRIDWSHSAILGHRGPAARDFADLVASRLIGPLLGYTQRRELLRQATSRGIAPFEANLIIATVLHHHAQTPVAYAFPSQKTGSQYHVPTWLIAIAVELAIVFCAWRSF